MGKGKNKRRKMVMWGLRAVGWVAALLFTFFALQILIFRYANPPLTYIQFSALLDGGRIEKKSVPIRLVSPNMVLAVMASEDQRFPVHQGFDFNAIKAALKNNLAGGRLRGGSTISQQVAKNVFLWPARTFLRKGLEVVYTVAIEVAWDKPRILERYMNVAQMGKTVFGVQAASRAYFGKPASRLTRQEAALLVTVLPSPALRDPSRPTRKMRRKAKWIRGQMGYLASLESTRTLMARIYGTTDSAQ